MRRIAARPLILGVVMAIVSVAAFVAPRHTSQTATIGVVLAVLSVAALFLSWAIPRWRLTRIVRRQSPSKDVDKTPENDTQG
ncbi:hypothetical protein [Curtobacterium luteum]|uniref:hypothetical protein n=1 Tax=Curtobacterium luteum TaxID=33881 RepID=UPI0037FDA9D0